MGKLFGKKKNESVYDEWEDLDLIEDEDGEYYAEEESGEYYETEESEEEFYEDEVYEDEVYEDEIYEDEVYADADSVDGYYESEEAEYEDEYLQDADMEEMSEEYDADMEYMEEDEEDEERSWSAFSDLNLFEKMWYKLSHMSIMDRVMVTTGVLVIILALVTGTVYGSSRIMASQVSSFDTVGSQLDGINLIGESGLLAVGDAELARLEAADLVNDDDEDHQYEEEDYSGEITVALDMSSIMKDLKIKFINKKTGKLIANVPFNVSVKTPDGKVETWADDDMDGIIYKKGIAHGNYVVELQKLTDEKYNNYTFESGSQSVKVKEKIDYEKVNVSNEIKSEAEIDASKEDTKKNETEVESQLKDTVAFVETTKTYIGNTYKEVAKSAITDPMKLAYNGVFARLSSTSGGDVVSPSPEPSPSESVNPTPSVEPSPDLPKSITLTPASLTGEVGKTATITPTGTNLATGSTYTWSSSNTGVATVDNGTVKFVAAGSTVITCSADGVSATCSVTVNDSNYTIGTVTIKEPALSLIVNGSSQKLTLQHSGYQPANAEVSVEWTSSKPEVATVSQTGEVSPKAAGTTEIKAKVFFKNKPEISAQASCNVTVSASRTMTFDYTTANAFVNTPFNLTVHANPAFAAPKAENFTVTSSDNSIATAKISADFKTVVVTPLKKGEVTITLTYKESASAQAVEAKCKLTVKATDPTKDTTTRLKDNAGNELWVLVDAAKQEYREAKYADYYKYDKFYIKSGEEYKYTGWTTINGKVYYYKADGKYVTGEQVIQGAKYNFASDGTLVTGSGMMGIDVSKWNGSIDWKAVKNSGVSYVIIRCGYRGSSAGSLIEDPKFKANIKGATDAGLKVGVYFFSQAIDEVEAVEEASMVLSLIKNYKISYPVFLDVESSGGRADGISKATRTAVIKAFCETIQNSGYTAGVYANKSWLTTKIDTSQLSRYKIWLAQYASAPTYNGRYEMWQYSSTGKINGISGNVDMNLSYLGY